MVNAKQEVVETLDELANERFRLEVEKDSLIAQFNADEAALEARKTAGLGPLQGQIDAIDARIWTEVLANRSTLIEPDKQSFVIMSAKFQLRKLSAKTKIIDAKAVMKVVRRLNMVRKVADPPKNEWRLNTGRFVEWLERNPKLLPFFRDIVEVTPAVESLTIKPNSGYTVVHDSRRVSPPSIKIEKG